MIVHRKGKYTLYSKSSHRRLGTYRTEKEAKKRERQIQYFKSLEE